MRSKAVSSCALTAISNESLGHFLVNVGFLRTCMSMCLDLAI